MKKLKVLALVLGMGISLSAMPVQAQGIWEGCGSGGNTAICADDTEASDIVRTIINTMLFVIGVLAVIMIIHSGLKYVISRGEAEQVKGAKNTLMYAVVGLVVAMLSFVIVNFVVDLFVYSGSNNAQIALTEGGSL